MKTTPLDPAVPQAFTTCDAMTMGVQPLHPSSRDIAQGVRTSYEADLSGVGAFLPAQVPGDQLPPALTRYLAACAELPARYAAANGGVRPWLDDEFRRPDPAVGRSLGRLDHGERDTLLTALCVLGHTYRWNFVPPSCDRFNETLIPLPRGLSEPWALLSRRCGQPRVGTTWSLHLNNWRMTDRPCGASYRPDRLRRDGLRLAHNWLQAPLDLELESFSIAFVLLEAHGGAVLQALVDAIECAAAQSADETVDALDRVRAAISAMTLAFTLNVRKRTVDPATWLQLIQPTFVWAAEAERPGRIEGGPSGMQLGTIQALDTALGVGGGSALSEASRSARRYMPIPHRRFLATLDLAGPLIRDFSRSRNADLADGYDRCIGALATFRAAHRARGAVYLRHRPPGDQPRRSTGLTISVDDDPVASFDRSMTERIGETQAAIIGACALQDHGDVSRAGDV